MTGGFAMMAVPKISILVITLTCFFLTNAGMAVEIRGINVATVAVSDQSPQTLQTALPQALEQVLIRMSGNTGVMTLPTVQDAVPQISHYVEKYSYATKTDESGKQQLLLQVVFDTRAVKRLLQNANQAIWSANRPLTMVWVSIPNGKQSQILASDSQNPALHALKQVAAFRGVPVIFPAMDLEDQINVAQPASTLPNNQQLQAISQRYGVDSILSGAVVSGENGQLQGEWQLFLNGTPYEWQTSGANVVQVVNNGIDRAADMMANQFATLDSKGMGSLATMQVTGVKTLDDYVHVVSTLKHLTPVAKVSVSDMNADMLLLKIKTIGNLDDLVKSLKSVSHLVAETAPTQPELNAANLFYRWKSNTPPGDSETPIMLTPPIH
ncbi:DUF2066 domain-containing protein [Coxiella burnetii]|uniref:DUF2066 domain-containing protein n=1 Tax=Coxiella burnetii TaxID=777 RepID=UPI000CCC24F7|nr:DUF2066 domain-containing protein [Coxiella burnetii]PNT88474.1 DUF2066 domain-containing protein [Coxiella burnetii]